MIAGRPGTTCASSPVHWILDRGLVVADDRIEELEALALHQRGAALGSGEQRREVAPRTVRREAVGELLLHDVDAEKVGERVASHALG